ncbi:hypothetical protein Cgig2_017246 [Carnegiea gigantea]|uniref:FAR1 domain-containing protein n=1 Tax=Carnegiea gigantea TaxID=171969 RepID=A0A9Q1JP25_9CARY|nr:hypothetical protein Cgig2_017246 [Carnegiea gigantea]
MVIRTGYSAMHTQRSQAKAYVVSIITVAIGIIEVVAATISNKGNNFLPFQGMEGVDPIEIIDKSQCVEDIVDDLLSEEKENEGTSSNFIGKRLDDLDENDIKKLIFKTPVKCEVFYFIYAKAVGLGVIRETLRINRHGMVTSLRFCCVREGVRSEKDKNREDKKRKARDETRCFCKAFISMKYIKKNMSVYSKRVQEGTQSSSCSTATSESDSSSQGYR